MSNNPNAFEDPIPCPDCNTMSNVIGHTGAGNFHYCPSCGITRFFFDFKCPVCKLVNRMWEKPKINVCFECSNCKIIVIFSEVIDTETQFNVKYKWYSGKFKDQILDKTRRFGRK